MSQVVIVGGGIIGLCTANYLLASHNAPTVTIVEATAIGAAASSKAAGFVAGGPGWHQPGNIDLARLSFEAYLSLVEQLDGEKSFGWRRMTATGVNIGNSDEMSAYRQLPTSSGAGPGWGARANGELSNITAEALGEILPHEFCSRLHTHLTAKGLKTVYGTPLALRRRERVLKTSAEDLYFDKLVLAAGPWTAGVCDTLGLPRAPVGTLPGHHVQIRPAKIGQPEGSVPYEALFCGVGATNDVTKLAGNAPDHPVGGWERQQGWTRNVEIFPRADGLVYIAGENAVPMSIGDVEIDAAENRLPPTAAGLSALIDGDLVKRMLRAAKAVSPMLDVSKGAQLVKAELCYRPITADKMPLIGEWVDDIYLCAGHGPWGITLAPGSGVVMAELILADLKNVKPELSADISGLEPHRFGPSRLANL